MNARVNQKLYCARLVLDVAAHSDGAIRSALLEATLFHLVTAYRCYLHEIIDSDRVVAPISADDAALQCRQCGLEPKPELNELAQLERSGAWPQRMLDAYAASIASSEPKRSVGVGIALADITASAEQDNCQLWLDQFQRLLQRQREHAREW